MTAPLSAKELYECRQVINTFLQGTAVISNESLVADGQGGYTRSYVASGTVAARLAKLAPDEFGGQQLVVAGQITEISSLIMNLPASTPVDEKSRIEYGGVTYEVAAVFDRTPEELVRRVRIREKVD